MAKPPIQDPLGRTQPRPPMGKPPSQSPGKPPGQPLGKPPSQPPGKPRLVTADELRKVAELQARYPNIRRRMLIQDAFFGSFYVEPGQVWPNRLNGQEGKMTILDAGTYGIYYEQKGKAYYSTAQDFQNNLRVYGPIEGARRAEGMVYLVKLEVTFIMGALAAASYAGLAVYLLTDAGMFWDAHAKDFPRWKIQIKAFREARRILKKHAPQLYEKLYSLFKQAVYDNFWDTISEEDIAFLVGQLVVSPGLGWLAKTFEPTWKVLLRALGTVLLRLGVRSFIVLAKSIPQTLAEIKVKMVPLAEALIKALKDLGVPINTAEDKSITEEMIQNAQEVLKAFQILKDAYDEVEKLEVTTRP
jgi:hypothetical protein